MTEFAEKGGAAGEVALPRGVTYYDDCATSARSEQYTSALLAVPGPLVADASVAGGSYPAAHR